MVREARQSAGLSQRQLAARAGVSSRTVAALEAGRSASWAVVEALLAACGLELTCTTAVVSPAACPHLHQHLRRSLTERLVAALLENPDGAMLLAALRAAATGRILALEATAAVGAWVPRGAVPLPVVVWVHDDPLYGHQPTPEADPRVLVVRATAEPAAAGLIAVRLPGGGDVHVAHAAVLARDPCCRAWRVPLASVARLLHEEAGVDAAGRRAPAHRQPNEDGESLRLSHTLRYTGVVSPCRPRAVDSRAFRLDAPVSLPQWLAENRLPPLRGQRGNW